VAEGFDVPGSSTRALARGGDHVMMMGLTQPLAEGDRFTLTLTFERSGKMVVVVPVRNDGPTDAGANDHSGGDHAGHGLAPASE
jgi:periplasmic copper chaperone A